MAHNRKCLHCGEPIPQEMRIDSLYCCDAHRKYASKERKKKNGKNRKANTSSLSGTSNALEIPAQKPVVIKQPEKVPEKIFVASPQEKDQPLTFSMMPPLRGYVENVKQVNLAKLPPPPEPPIPFIGEQPLEIEKRHEAYYVTLDNPEFKRLKELKENQFRTLEAQRDLLNRHEKDLQNIRSSENMTGLQYVLAGTVGGLAGHEMAGQQNKAGGTFLGIFGGLALAFVKDWSSKEDFEKQKTKAIQVQIQNVSTVRSYLIGYEKDFNATKEAFAHQSQLLSVHKSRLVNAQAIAERDEEIKQYNKLKEKADEEFSAYSNLVANYEAKYGSIESVNEGLVNAEEMPQAEVNDPNVVSSLGLNKVVGGALLLKGVWRHFLGAPSRDFKLIIHGASFSGKSHLALQLANYLALHHGTVLYNTSEEGFSRTMNSKVEKLGAQVKGLDIGKFTTVDALKEIPRTTYNFIILDSVNDMNMDAEELQELRRYYCCSAIIGVCQNTKAGDIRGGYDLVHDADIKIRVEDKIAYTDKNRFIEDRPQLEIFKIGAVPAVESKSFSEKKEKQEDLSEELSEEKSTGKIIQLPTSENKQETDSGENNSGDLNIENDEWIDENDFDSFDHVI